MTKWNTFTIKLSNDISFDIVSNIPESNNGINDIQAAIDNWVVRTNQYTDKSFVNYINSKTQISGFKAFTLNDFDKKGRIK